MHQRTGKAWKVLVPAILLLLGVVVGVLAYPMISARLNPSSLTSKPTPFIPFGMPAVTPEPTANTNYTARDIMQYILNTGDKPASITYDQEINGMDGTPLSVHATSSVDFTEGPAGSEPDSYSIIVYKTYADTKQAFNYQLNAVYTFTPPAGQPSTSPGYPYLHGRCLLIGADGASVYGQVVTKYCV